MKHDSVTKPGFIFDKAVFNGTLITLMPLVFRD